MNLTLTAASKYGLGALALFGVSLGLHYGRAIFIPLIISAMLASILYPWARSVQRTFKLPWFLSCCSVMGALILTSGVIFVLLAQAVPNILNSLPNDSSKLGIAYLRMRAEITSLVPTKMSPSPDELKTALRDLEAKDDQARQDAKKVVEETIQSDGFYKQIANIFEGKYIADSLLNLGKQGMQIIVQSLLILFVLLFLLLEGRMLTEKIRNIFGPGFGVQQQITSAFREMAESVRSYLIWRTLVNFGLAVFLGVVYYSLGLKQYMLWAVLTFILCYVPYLGTIAAGVPPILEAFVLPDLGAQHALGILIFYSLVVTFEGYIIVPWVMGRSMDLNATVVIISCIYWEEVWGTAGLFLAMPLMAAIKAVCLQVEGWHAWGHLMSSEDLPPLTAAEEKPPLQDEVVIMKLTPEKHNENVTPSPLP